MTDPVALLKADREAARAASDPMAGLCIAASVASGEPSARTLVLRDLDDHLAVFVNAGSPKVEEFAGTETVLVLVYLPSRQVQYRMRCTLTPVAEDIVHENWQLRPRVPQQLDWLYAEHRQGSVVSSREELAGLIHARTETTAPPSAIGYVIHPVEVDRLLLDQPDGIHDRRRYLRGDAEWTETILVP